MKTPHPDSESNWQKRVERARADTPPAVDVPALLRAVRTAAPPPARNWSGEIAALFASRRVGGVCAAGAALLSAFGTWQAWTIWQALPWAQLLVSATGGRP